MKQIRLGFYGMGVVGCGTVVALRDCAKAIGRRLGIELLLERVVVANPQKKRPIPLDGVKISARAADLLEDTSLDVVVEVAGGLEEAGELVISALKANKAVVTANKALLAERGKEVFEAASQNRAFLGLEGAVAGGVPVMRVLSDSLCADDTLQIFGILNGTANYILWSMSETNASFEDALKSAQNLGYAEADPTFDVDGFDAAHKLTILASLASGKHIPYSAVYKEGIRKITPLDITYARELGYAIRLLGVARLSQNTTEVRVHPVLTPKSHPLASVNEAFNAVYLKGKHVGPLLLYGQGAGGAPTGVSVAGDIVEAAQARLIPQGHSTLKNSFYTLQGQGHPMSIGEACCAYYLRFQVKDEPGVLAQITEVMGRRGISIRSMIQPEQTHESNQPAQIIVTTHLAKEESVSQSLKEIAPKPFILKATQLLRIEPMLLE